MQPPAATTPRPNSTPLSSLKTQAEHALLRCRVALLRWYRSRVGTRPRQNYTAGLRPEYRAALLARILAKIDATGDCWEWTGYRTNGYGVVRVGPAPRFVHNILWELLVGPTPLDLEPDHRCQVRHCVNPDHIEYVTHEENVRRCKSHGGAYEARKTRCPEGHPYDAVDSRGYRFCRQCVRAQRRAA